MGAALRRLRERAGLTQTQAADNMNVTLQAWGNYERGERQFKRQLIESVTAAIGSTPEALAIEAARDDEIGRAPTEAARFAEERFARRFELPIAGYARAGGMATAVYEPDQQEMLDLAPFFGPTVRVLMVQGESMIPYAQPGGFVTYDVKTWPRKGDGCVIIFKGDRDPMVKRFEKTLGSTLYVTELYPQEQELTFNLAEVEAVYRVGFRAD